MVIYKLPLLKYTCIGTKTSCLVFREILLYYLGVDYDNNQVKLESQFLCVIFVMVETFVGALTSPSQKHDCYFIHNNDMNSNDDRN